jgi:hypothetical protein
MRTAAAACAGRLRQWARIDTGKQLDELPPLKGATVQNKRFAVDASAALQVKSAHNFIEITCPFKTPTPVISSDITCRATAGSPKWGAAKRALVIFRIATCETRKNHEQVFPITGSQPENATETIERSNQQGGPCHMRTNV